MERVIERCKIEAKKSGLNQKHAAVILHRTSVLIISHNVAPVVVSKIQQSMKSKSFVYGGLHAEMAAIQKFVERYPRRLLQECTMIVVRVNGSNEMVNSKPCKYCQAYIQKYNVPKVYYS